ncbi:terminase small subunit [Deinococcus daejeonensis]|uniref:Terminase small subunit n=1 Tax=Deinococcus daejeonensis TaxID=1007098 RepID=A0ABQ2IVK1_9DEIO|nr:terminase small subunit [Deinococcus daejeonensis]GGN32320.1 terminase small subunit [Deinococcus daejeonensis]
MTQIDQPQPKTAEELGAALNPKHRQFAEAYAQCGDAQAAARAAGYADGSAKFTGSRLMKRADIGTYLRALAAEASTDRIATVRELQEFWTGIMRSASEEPKDRLKASELLGKSFGAFIERKEHTGGLTIQVVYGDE